MPQNINEVWSMNFCALSGAKTSSWALMLIFPYPTSRAVRALDKIIEWRGIGASAFNSFHQESRHKMALDGITPMQKLAQTAAMLSIAA